jgi:hypothetical protein
MGLSIRAMSVLERMDPQRSYEPTELRAFAPDLSVEELHDVMRELWVQRQVERVGYAGWRRDRSLSPATETTLQSGTSRGAGARATRHTGVKPEELFDHSAFEGIFK